MDASYENTSRTNVTSLTESNFAQFENEMTAFLDTRMLSRYLEVTHSVAPAVDAAKPETAIALTLWEDKHRAVCGHLYRHLDASIQGEFIDQYQQKNAYAFWSALVKRFRTKRPGQRFQAMGDELNIKMTSSDTLTDLYSRVMEKSRERKRLRPTGYSLKDFDDEFDACVWMRALPEEYGTLATAIHVSNGEKALEMSTIHAAARVEDDQQLTRGKPAAAAMRARAAAAVPSSTGAPAPFARPVSIIEALKRLHKDAALTRCLFCDSPEHSSDACKRREAILKAGKDSRESYNRSRNEGRKDDKKSKANVADAEPAASSNAAVRHFVSASSAELACAATSSRASADWNADTGCSAHMTPNRRWFRTLLPYRTPIRLADDTIIYSEGVGAVEFVPRVDGVEGPPVVFDDVLYVPALGVNLFSVFHVMTNRNFEIHGKSDVLKFERDGKVIFTATVTSNIGYLDGRSVVCETANRATTASLNLELWHRRFAHANVDAIKNMEKTRAVKGMSIKGPRSKSSLCEPCLAGKLHRHDVPRGPARRADRRLGMVHADLKGPLKRSIHGFLYWIIFLDDRSRLRRAYFLRKKSDAFDAFVDYVAWAERQTGEKVRLFHNDKGGEFVGKRWDEFCKTTGIEIKHTERAEPYQNGVAERAHRDTMEAATAMLVEAKLPASFWLYAVEAYTYIHNRTCTTALNPGETPFEIWYGRKPDVSHFRVFGSLAYTLVPADKRKSFDSHYAKATCLGYSDTKPGCWRFYNAEKRIHFESSQAVFDEHAFPGNSRSPIDLLATDLTPSDVPGVLDTGPEDDGDEPPAVPDAPVPQNPNEGMVPPPPSPSPPRSLSPMSPLTPTPPPLPRLPEVPAAPVPVLPTEPATSERRSKRNTRYTGSLGEPDLWRTKTYPTSLRATVEDVKDADDVHVAMQAHDVPDNELFSDEAIHRAMRTSAAASLADFDTFVYEDALEFAFDSRSDPMQNEPRTYAEAMRRPTERDAWRDAAHLELENLVRMQVVKMVQLPEGARAIGCKWVFKVKRDENGNVERYKARLVARGDAQRPGFDYTETFSPTPRWPALRTVFALAAQEGLLLWSVDITAAYLNGDLDETVYMKFPEGFKPDDPKTVLALLKSLYGLKQAGRNWHLKLDRILVEMGFERIAADNSVWVYGRGEERVIVPVFVDDMTLAAKSRERIAATIAELAKHLELRDLGPTKWLLGVEVKRDGERGAVGLCQRQYLTDVLNRFDLANIAPVHTPMDSNAHYSTQMSPQNDDDRAAMQNVPYLNLLGAIAYAAIATRPDLAYAVGVLARFQTNPGREHWTALKHLARYVAGTLDYMLVYAPSQSGRLFETYSDADHGGNVDNGRSTTGMVVKIGSGAVSWSSKLQSIVALSTTEAEYVAACSSGQEIVWMRKFLEPLGYLFDAPPRLSIDNQSAVQVARNPQHHGRMKHLDLRFHWLREMVERGLLEIVHIGTDQMPADILTKALPRQKLDAARKMLGLARSFSEFVPHKSLFSQLLE